jgi:hypothetical protein
MVMTDHSTNPKQTGIDAASAASAVLKDPKATDAEKKAAASALSQTPPSTDSK